MPLPEKKASTPFKTMDIKTAFLAGANRKRKASSPQKAKTESKSLKLSVESSEGENDEKIIDEACGIPVTVDQSEFESNHVESKENKDINAAKVEILSSDNKLNAVKDDISLHKNAISCNGTVNSKSSEHVSDMDVDQVSEKSDNSSGDELNSTNVSLNTSGLSITGNDDEKVNNSSNSDAKNVSNNSAGKEVKTEESKKAKKKKMTPAEAHKKAEEREQKNKEKMLKKQELENKKKERQLEREQALREKQLRKEREEMERKERERLKQEKKEQEEKEKLQKQKEREEKAKIKQMMLEHKMGEKKKKEEMRLKKEEEIRKAEEEKLKAKLEKEQKEREKKERAKAAFAKFFQKKDANTSTAAQQVPEKGLAFLPFQVSDDMTLAPVIPAAAQERFNRGQLDHYLEKQDGKELYLHILKSGSYKDVRQRKKNRKLAASSDADIIVIDKNAQTELGLCPKLLQFCENVRPPYWGTWRRKSTNIRPRNPFGQDEIFDYDVDSDDEWDEGGPGESLSGTEDEKEEESEDDYEVDNEFFVPHGYLSDEEEKKEDDDEEVNDPEKQKALLKLKLQEFEKERKKKTTELKPIILGCYFMNDPAFQDSGLHGLLEVYTAVFLTDTLIPTSFNKSQQSDMAVNSSESPNSSSVKKKKNLLVVPEEAFPDLIRLVHGNTKKRTVLAEMFQKYWLVQFGEAQATKTEADKLLSNPAPDASQEVANDLPPDSAQISLRQLNHTIREIASYGKPPVTTFNKCCWWVNDEVRKKYGLMEAPIPNQWNFVSPNDPELSAKANGPTIKEFLSNNVEK